MRVAIHQPNFLPWLGFFAKAAQADVLVLLDDVPFSRGSYTNRVRVMGPNGPAWLTVPFEHVSPMPLIRDLRTAGDDAFDVVDRQIRSWYRGPDDERWMPAWIGNVIHEAARRFGRRLPLTNASVLWTLLGTLQIRTRLVWASTLRATPTPGSAGLVQLCRAAGGTSYVAGLGALAYEDVSLFESAGIEYRPLRFTHPVYPQRRRDGSPAASEFVPGLSVVDALCNAGQEETRRLIREVVR